MILSYLLSSGDNDILKSVNDKSHNGPAVTSIMEFTASVCMQNSDKMVTHFIFFKEKILKHLYFIQFVEVCIKLLLYNYRL